MTLYEKYSESTPIGFIGCSNWGGVEVLDYLPGIEDYLVTAFNYGTRYMIRRNKVLITPSGRMYFRKLGRRYYLDEVIGNEH